MQEISTTVIVILCLYVIIGVLDQISIQIGFYTPLFAATITGLLLGNLSLGLTIGATLQLMTLGVATYGGPQSQIFYRELLWERRTLLFQDKERNMA